MLPYHCDALLPTAQRYASMRFRRVAQRIELRLLDWDAAVELVAFVESVGGLRFARYIFHWKGQAPVRAYHALRMHVGDAVAPAVAENESHMSVDVGLAVLAAMRDGGWTHGKLPWVVKFALKDLRKRGMAMPAIAEATGLTIAQVRTACDAWGRADKRREQAAAFASLAV